MGFTDKAKCLSALDKASGNVDNAIEYLDEWSLHINNVNAMYKKYNKYHMTSSNYLLMIRLELELGYFVLL